MEAKRKFLGLGFIVGLVIGLSLFFGLYFGLPPPECTTTSDTKEDPVKPGYAKYKTAAVASDAGVCSGIGTKLLGKGGHVVDAAIATALCAGLYNPHSAGIGGGFFMSIYDAPSKELLFVNGREVAPLAADKDLYGGNGFLSQIGSLAIAVPGEIAGYWEAHKRYGKLPWADLFEDAIELATNGIKVSPALETAIIKEEKYIRNTTFNLDPIFVNPDGSLKKEGDIVVRTALANTLRSIAEGGVDEFYNGTLAQRITSDIEDAVEDSIITLEDLKKYQVEVKPLLNITIGELTVFTPGPPSSGAVLALILNILKGYEFTSNSMSNTESSTLSFHRIVEAFKFAYAHRSQLGDERFNDDVVELVANMTSDTYAENLRLKISDDTTHNSSYYGGDFSQVENDGTSHHSLIGSDGSAVAITSTINTKFGSKVRGIRTGIIFNNEMDDFSSPNVTNYFDLPPSPANFIEPQKRPLSSMCPSIVLQNGQNRPLLVTGASGGTKITTGTSLVMMHSIWFGKSIEDATSAKRLHHQLYPEELQHQEGFNSAILSGLEAKNHVLEQYTGPGSVVQSVQSLKDDDVMTAVCDERKGGYPGGY